MVATQLIIENAGASSVTDDAIDAFDQARDEIGEILASEVVKETKRRGSDKVKKKDVERIVINIHDSIGVTIGLDKQDIMNINEISNINFEKSFNKLYEQSENPETDKQVQLIQDELKEDKVSVSKIKKAIDWLKINASWTIPTLAQIFLKFYGIFPAK